MAEPQYMLPAWLREFGAIAGLLSFGFVLFDRLLKDRLRASITMDDHGPVVMLANPSTVDVTMTGFHVTPAAYAIARDVNIDNIVLAAAGKKFSATIKATGSKQFALVALHKGEVKQTDVHGRGIILLFWRRNSSLWLPQFPVVATYDVAIIKSLRRGAE